MKLRNKILNFIAILKTTVEIQLPRNYTILQRENER